MKPTTDITRDDEEDKQIDEITLDSFRRWHGTPKVPKNSNFAARIVHLVSPKTGILQMPVRYMSEINSLESLLRWCPAYDGVPGEEIVETVDLKTTAGYALLLHPLKTVVDEDYQKLVLYQQTMYPV